MIRRRRSIKLAAPFALDECANRLTALQHPEKEGWRIEVHFWRLNDHLWNFAVYRIPAGKSAKHILGVEGFMQQINDSLTQVIGKAKGGAIHFGDLSWRELIFKIFAITVLGTLLSFWSYEYGLGLAVFIVLTIFWSWKLNRVYRARFDLLDRVTAALAE